ERGLARAPVRLAEVLAARADLERRPADRGHHRTGRGEVGGARAGGLELVAVVAAGELHADALHRRVRHELIEYELVGRIRRVGRAAPRVGQLVGEVAFDDLC